MVTVPPAGRKVREVRPDPAPRGSARGGSRRVIVIARRGDAQGGPSDPRPQPRVRLCTDPSPQSARARRVPFASVCVHTWAKTDRSDSENPASFPGAEARGDRVAGSPPPPCWRRVWTHRLRVARVASASGPGAACPSPSLSQGRPPTPGTSLSSFQNAGEAAAQSAVTLGDLATLAEPPFPPLSGVQG